MSGITRASDAGPMTSSAAGVTLRWRRIRWNGVNSEHENSGEALDGDISIGRVYRAHNSDAWQWSMYAMRHGVQRAGFAFDGEAPTKEEGKRRVEEAYAELLRRAESYRSGNQPSLDVH